MKKLSIFCALTLVLLMCACEKEESNSNQTSVIALYSPEKGGMANAKMVTFNWQKSPYDIGHDIVYDFCISTDSINWTRTAGLKDTLLVLSSLKKGTKYYWKVNAYDFQINKTTDDIKSESASDVFVFYTTPTGIDSLNSDYDDATVTLKWQEPADCHHIEISFTPTVASIAQPIKVNTGLETFVVKGLKNNTKYQFEVKASDEYGHTSEASTINEMPLNKAECVHDIEFNIYRTVTIGDQVWLRDNLKSTKYNDGTAFWSSTCYNADLPEGYGCIYRADLVNRLGKNIAPKGYRVPTDDDWKKLERFIGMPESEIDFCGYGYGMFNIPPNIMIQRGAVNKCGKLLAAQSGWVDENGDDKRGSDFYNFTIYPSGFAFSSNDPRCLGQIAYLLTSTPKGESGHCYFRGIDAYSDGIYRFSVNENSYFGAIRCVKE